MSLNGNDEVSDTTKVSAKGLQAFVSDRFRQDKIPILRFFLAYYKSFPCLMTVLNVEEHSYFYLPQMLKYLHEKFHHDPTKDVVNQTFHRQSKEFVVSQRLCNLADGLMLLIDRCRLMSGFENPNRHPAQYSDDHYLIAGRIKFCFYPKNDSLVKEMIDQFTKMTLIQSQTSLLKLIIRRGCAGYNLVSIKVKNPTIHDLALHYGEEFVDVHQKIFKELSKTDGKGIVLLHGVPGSGKTHYIRYLIEIVKDKNLIYVPPDMAKDLSKPAFLSFLLQFPNSILIIEDAENIVRDRNEFVINPTQAVANLLNLSDGLLGDALSMQIIATFNCDLTSIDPALLRPGRLIANYAFDRLNVANAKRLSTKLGLGEDHITNPMTLAEIYNSEHLIIE